MNDYNYKYCEEIPKKSRIASFIPNMKDSLTCHVQQIKKVQCFFQVHDRSHA